MHKANTERVSINNTECMMNGAIDSVTRWGVTKGNWKNMSDNVKGSRKQSHATRMTT